MRFMKKAVWFLLSVIFVMECGSGIILAADKYSLKVTEAPEAFGGKAYAGFHDSDKSTANLSLALYENYDALISIENALEDAGEDPAGIELVAMETMLYETDDNKDSYPVTYDGAIAIACPIPDSLKAHKSNLQILTVNEKDRLERVRSQVEQVNGVECLVFDGYADRYYAMSYKESGKITVGKIAASTPVPTPSEATNTFTPKPTATKAPDKITPVAVNGGNKDKTPQTGDDYPIGLYVGLFACGMFCCVGAAVLFKKSKKK